MNNSGDCRRALPGAWRLLRLKEFAGCATVYVITLLWLVLTVSVCFAEAQTKKRLISLEAGGKKISAELAVTHEERVRGLMHRHSLRLNSGMLFVFPALGWHCMWMKNTKVPLSAAFIDNEGKIVNIADMTPGSETFHCADRPVRYVLEMNKGWFGRHGISPGAVVKGLENAPPSL